MEQFQTPEESGQMRTPEAKNTVASTVGETIEPQIVSKQRLAESYRRLGDETLAALEVLERENIDHLTRLGQLNAKDNLTSETLAAEQKSADDAGATLKRVMQKHYDAASKLDTEIDQLKAGFNKSAS